MGGDWEEGLPWLLLAAREASQESMGFSLNELVFGHFVRGPLMFLADYWKAAEPPKNVLTYFSDFRRPLYEACELAKLKLGHSQDRMKRLFES